MDREQAVAEVREIIQRTYGDATQATLDDRCAQAIVEHFEQAWMSPRMLRALIASVGGTVTLDDRHLMDPPELLVSHRDPMTGDQKLSVR